MLNKVKLALRISGNAFDDEINGLIDSAVSDLKRVGIAVTLGAFRLPTRDALLDRAIIFYAKAYFGHSDDAEKYRTAYEHLKCALSLSSDYTSREDDT